MVEQTASITLTPNRRRAQAIRITGLFVFLLAALIAAAPWIIAHTGLAGPSIAVSDSAFFGWFTILFVLAFLLAALIAAAPWIVAHTGLRNSVIDSILASPSLTASSDSASFGWLSPQSIFGLHLSSANKQIDVRVAEITVERSPWQLRSSAPDLGTI